MAKPEIADLVRGAGPEAVRGKTVEVHYTGWLADGTQFDSSVGGAPFSFRLGAGPVVEGWGRGGAGLKVGGKRERAPPPARAPRAPRPVVAGGVPRTRPPSRFPYSASVSAARPISTATGGWN